MFGKRKIGVYEKILWVSIFIITVGSLSSALVYFMTSFVLYAMTIAPKAVTTLLATGLAASVMCIWLFTDVAWFLDFLYKVFYVSFFYVSDCLGIHFQSILSWAIFAMPVAILSYIPAVYFIYCAALESGFGDQLVDLEGNVKKFKSISSQVKENKPLALYLVSNDDNKTFFHTDALFLYYYTYYQLRKHYNVIFKVSGSSLENDIKDAIGSQTLALCVLGGHGTKKSMQIGNEKYCTGDLKKALCPHMEKNSTVVFLSCEAKRKATLLNKSLKGDGIQFIGSEDKITGLDIEKDGDQIKVNFYT